MTRRSTYQRNRDAVVQALRENESIVHETLIGLLTHLGSREEWSMGDNFMATEEIARLAQLVGLPAAGDQSDEALDFWRSLDPSGSWED